MGRKKGRQCGRFSSKAQNASYSTEFQIHALEARAIYSNGGKTNKINNNQITVAKKDVRTNDALRLAPLRVGRPSMGHLRGLLIERRWEDRFQDREVRLRSHMRRNVINSVTTKVAGTLPLQNAPGWIHFQQNEKDVKRENMFKWLKKKYNIHDKHASYIDDENKQENGRIKVASLQSLCIKVLASHLDQYIDHFDRDSIHSIISSLSSQAITCISTLTVCQNYDMVQVLGNHNHLDRLTLQFDQHMNLQNKESKNLSMDNAIIDLMPKVQHNKLTHLHENCNENSKQNTPVLRNSFSWEDMLDDHENEYFTKDLMWKGCIQLTRFEIRDATNISSSTIFTVLQKCTKLTHLSLCNSLNSHTGMEVLLDSKKGVFGRNVRFSCIGEVLDLSFCNWLTDGILMQLLQLIAALSQASNPDRVCEQDMKLVWEETDVKEYKKLPSVPLPSIRIIRVMGCPFINIEKCNSCSREIIGRKMLIDEEHESKI